MKTIRIEKDLGTPIQIVETSYGVDIKILHGANALSLAAAIFEHVGNQSTIGVGDGTGKHFVRGSHDTIKLLQSKLLELEELRRQHVGEWVSVDVKPTEENNHYHVKSPNGFVTIAYYDEHDNTFVSPYSNGILEDVTHYMPIPQPKP